MKQQRNGGSAAGISGAHPARMLARLCGLKLWLLCS